MKALLPDTLAADLRAHPAVLVRHEKQGPGFWDGLFNPRYRSR